MTKSIKSASDLIDKFEIDQKILKRDQKELKFFRIQLKRIKNKKIYQLFGLNLTFLMDFDFFNLLINIKVIFLKSFN